jgi:hypothetical protein
LTVSDTGEDVDLPKAGTFDGGQGSGVRMPRKPAVVVQPPELMGMNTAVSE